ncbi:uracil-DNA glycosylase [Erysipelotrichaceae bacterium AF15-26LB]|nr:uracil-DNA glycosylase [[Clostridium] innocuum]RJV84719.1 uracil-DNA glycosylase [Erysipelotrichaceae bacterium AF15-26LB]RJV85393.1 uracil-DNA glycosylase [Erysipelotrichaceae bacterium AF19-24AC]
MKNWEELFRQEEQKEYYQKLMQFLDEEYAQKTIYPPREDVFTCFTSCPLQDVKVVILGQDPYHQPQQAHGLCFSVRKGVPVPRSLKNIYRELKGDLGVDAPSHGCLLEWARQGVFLMNTVMTVREGEAYSHNKKGWEVFTDTVISVLNEQEQGIVFVLWGNHAQKKARLITGAQHRIIQSAHPSPLSASRGFFGSKPFSTINTCLKEMGRTPIDWRLSE